MASPAGAGAAGARALQTPAPRTVRFAAGASPRAGQPFAVVGPASNASTVYGESTEKRKRRGKPRQSQNALSRAVTPASGASTASGAAPAAAPAAARRRKAAAKRR